VFCNGAETCQSGVCTAGGDPCTGQFCDETADMCTPSNCTSSPLMGCRTAAKSLLLMKNKDSNEKDGLVWKWIKGDATSQMEFADPTTPLTGAYYALCIYQNGTDLVGTMDIPPGANWTQAGSKGYKYFDASNAADGASKIKLKGSASSKSKILLKARGNALMDPLDTAALSAPVKVQFVNKSTGVCFESNFMTPKSSTTKKFKAKAP
jgi:hypothetical protein